MEIDEDEKCKNELFLGIYIISTILIMYVISVTVQFALYAWSNGLSAIDNFTLEVIWDRSFTSTYFEKRKPFADLLAMIATIGYVPLSWWLLKLVGLKKRLLDSVGYE